MWSGRELAEATLVKNDGIDTKFTFPIFFNPNTLEQELSIFLMLRPLNTVPHVVMAHPPPPLNYFSHCFITAILLLYISDMLDI